MPNASPLPPLLPRDGLPSSYLSRIRLQPDEIQPRGLGSLGQVVALERASRFQLLLVKVVLEPGQPRAPQPFSDERLEALLDAILRPVLPLFDHQQPSSFFLSDPSIPIRNS